MDSSSSASSSSPSYQYNGAVSFPASSTSSGRPRWPDLPIYESVPHYPPSVSPYSNYGYDYGSFNHAGVRGGDAGGPGGGSMAVEVSERREGDEAMEAVEKEHMFDKVVTPSDVGKLNRLVIPKQHAEKYFPLDSASGDSKGLLLNFEDRSGKSWRFRYSYWNSSQSYVMTKGWSRFVKEKKLDAGDIVSFHRGAAESDKDRFYIDWRRRPDAPPYHHPFYRFQTYPADAVQFPHDFSLHRPIHPPFYNLSPPMPPPTLVDHHRHARDLHRGGLVGYNALTTNSTSGGYGGNYGMVSPNFCHHQSGSVIYLGAAAAAAAPQQQMRGAGRSSQMRIGGAIDEPTVFDSVPVVHGGKAASAKRFRLFGVNMDCTDPQDECDINRHQHHHHHLHDFNILDSDRISSTPGAESALLQLRLHNNSGASTSSMQASELVDKGKSSMSLDLDI